MNISEKNAIWLQWVFHQLSLDCQYPFNLIDENTPQKWQLVVDFIYRFYVCGLIAFDCDDIDLFCRNLSQDNPFDENNLLSIHTNWWSVDICLIEKGQKIFDKYFYNEDYKIFNKGFIDELNKVFNSYGVPVNKTIFGIVI